MKTLAFLILFVASSQAQSANMSFLKNSVLTDFSKEDIQDFKQFAHDSLDTIKDKEVVIWKAKSSPMSGKLKLIATYETGGNTCRRSRFLVANKDRREIYQFEICRVNNQWQIQDTAVGNLTKQDMKFIKSTTELALAHQGDSIPFSWANTKSGNTGVAVPLASIKIDQKTCRDLAITIFTTKGKSANGTYNFCREKDGSWARNIKAF
jgi:surface antigen